jgi:riboflavin biosynthesis pyrimidine reductase
MSFLAAPLEVLYEAPGLPEFDLPDELRHDYGGPLGFQKPRLLVNFVASIDGITAVPSLPNSNRLIAGDSPSDHFVMGLLRACADALVIGSGTMKAAPRSLWTPEQAYPAAGAAFAELRRRLGLATELELVVLTARGSVDPGHLAFAAGALVLTTDAGAEGLRDELPPATTVVSLGPDRELDLRAAFDLLAARGRPTILCEGGPHIFGSLLEARLVDELFLTISPLLAGRPASDDRIALVEGTDLLPDGPLEAHLLGLRREGNHLFLRYELTR